jgi:molybdenum cofactor guanylyltransferase
MNTQVKVSGVVLAGGQAQRMDFQDKGLLEVHGRPMISYTLDAMAAIVDEILISANRNLGIYQQFGYRVISDNLLGYAGPLAGILMGMQAALYPLLLVAPCDSPQVKPETFRRLLQAIHKNDVDIAVAHDGIRPHPVFLAIKTGLQSSLETYLDSGERKLYGWLQEHSISYVDFSDAIDQFSNINTIEDLNQLQIEK